MYLRCLADDRPKSWLRWLPWAEYCYNTSHQTTLKTTPFQVVYGRAPPPMIPFQEGETKVPVVDRQLQDRDLFLSEIQECLLQAQARMKTAHDAAHRDMEFDASAWVWLRLNQRTTLSVRDGAHSKLAPQFFGPYQVLERVGPLAYKLQLPSRAHIHNVFHVALLKRFVSTPLQ
jgi:hypothetical protein